MAATAVAGALLAACGGDTIGDNILLLGADGGPSADATIPDTGSPDTSVIPPVDGGQDSGASCTDGKSVCGLDCVDESSDGNNCGACGHICMTGTVCNASLCALSCNGGTTACGNSCVNELDDVSNCGGCGIECASGLVCSAGQCSVACGAGLTRCSARSGAGLDGGVEAGDAGDAGAVPTTCVDSLEDRANCGGCGIACASGQVCSAGACAATCQPGLVQCGGNCVDPLTNKNFCGVTNGCKVGIELADGGVDAGGAAAGTFGEACGIGQVCSGGTCQLTCAANQVSCGGECIDPNTNASFCGAAGNCTNIGTGNKAGSICPAGEICNGSGVCTISCQAGQVKCGSTCVDPTSNGDFCGATTGCGTITGGVTTGSPGAVCAGGTVCTKNGAGLGTCQTMCAQGQSLCNGTCIDPNTDANFCGASANCSNKGTNCLDGNHPGTVCGGAAKGCVTSCQINEVLCGGKCIDPSTNETYCGARGTCVTAPLDNADSQGTTCNSALGTGNQVCNGGTCQASCATGFVLCNGACVDPLTDDSFCGATTGCGQMVNNVATGSSGSDCGSGANSGTTCSGGACIASCGTGLSVCTNACVDESVDPNHCGSCAPCEVNNNAPDCITTTTNGRTSTACALGVCNAGYSDCANGETDGCETQTSADPSNCGACNRVCPNGDSCASGVCYDPTAVSCAAILAAHPASTDGVYTIQPAGNPTSFSVYCQMVDANDGTGAGWTLILKSNGDTTFAYASSYWSDAIVLNATDTTLAVANAKYASFSTVPFTQIRGILDGFPFVQNNTATSATALFTSEIGNDDFGPIPPQYQTDPDSPNFQLEPFCQMYGIDMDGNSGIDGATVRFGWTANENAPGDCGSNDTAIGFGVAADGNAFGAGYIALDDPGQSDKVASGVGTLWVK